MSKVWIAEYFTGRGWWPQTEYVRFRKRDVVYAIKVYEGGSSKKWRISCYLRHSPIKRGDRGKAK